ncbi:hypothetical protein I5643_004078 [Salmonella enterica]|nr:hypothetical protein [Salmonella enterica]EAQ8070333.1 hypothetical protein [Salmonella enterica]EDG2519531.1 hypothetical protein [Salmonella enterica]EGA5656232.1 hypothetical protein [Salmonella enterica]EGQ7138612.1 hypothetical protein [Salmonella enterica]
MLNKYSPSLNTFYLAQFFERYEVADSMPDDAFEVSDEVFALYTADPPEGMTRVAGTDNLPCWAEIPGEVAENAED